MEFTLEATFEATCEQVYTAWLTSHTHSQMTGGNAQISDENQAEFTAWDGYIWGKNLELDPPRYIRQSWRTSDFAADQAFSNLEIRLMPVDSNRCKLVLTHSDLTTEDAHYKQGWIDNYFEPMKRFFEEN